MMRLCLEGKWDGWRCSLAKKRVEDTAGVSLVPGRLVDDVAWAALASYTCAVGDLRIAILANLFCVQMPWYIAIAETY